MRTATRRLAAMVMVPLLFVLSGCVRLDTTVEIRNENNISMSLDLAVDKESFRRQSDGEELDKTAVCDQLPLPGRRTAYDRDGFVGCRIDQRGSSADLGSLIKLERAADSYKVQLRASDELVEMMADPEAKIDQFNVTVKFPGKVTEHNGAATVKGNSVTWHDQRDFFSEQGLRATGGATDPFDAVLPWLVIGGGLLLIGGGIIVARAK